jgi:UDP-GlcNAc3NAcA epimerase
MKKRIITIIGTRPQIIKSSAINRAINTLFSEKIDEIIVHTGQHYDENMSAVFFDELGISKPTYNLNVGSSSHAIQTAKMTEGIEAILIKEKPDAVLVYGDTNSTIAGALAASKIHIPVIHVEAGLRSYNKYMPEEINRIACDHMSTLLFTPTLTGVENLKKEGFSLDINDEKATLNNPKVYYCGDIMYDNSLYFSSVSDEKSTILADLNIQPDAFVLVTIHRDSNTDIPTNLQQIIRALLAIQEKSGLKIVLPLHPRTQSKLKEQLGDLLFDELNANECFIVIPPVGFLDVIALEKNARIIITDSGGLQKEAFFFQKPCLILRDQTEWVEIVSNGNALIVGASQQKIIAGFDSLMKKNDFTFPALFGDGKAAAFICSKIVSDLS